LAEYAEVKCPLQRCSHNVNGKCYAETVALSIIAVDAMHNIFPMWHLQADCYLPTIKKGEINEKRPD
jgi:hypothetical protein